PWKRSQGKGRYFITALRHAFPSSVDFGQGRSQILGDTLSGPFVCRTRIAKMKAIKRTYWVLFAVITLLWWLADDSLAARGFFPLRSSLVNLSGLLAMGAMSLAVLLAVRPALLERRLGGLDKVYRLHKWLGISALVLSVIHWGWAQIPKWLVGWGLLEKPARKGLGAPQEGILGWFHSQRGLAESIGEWAFYAAVVLIVLALVKRFPY